MNTEEEACLCAVLKGMCCSNGVINYAVIKLIIVHVQKPQLISMDQQFVSVLYAKIIKISDKSQTLRNYQLRTYRC